MFILGNANIDERAICSFFLRKPNLQIVLGTEGHENACLWRLFLDPSTDFFHVDFGENVRFDDRQLHISLRWLFQVGCLAICALLAVKTPYHARVCIAAKLLRMCTTLFT